MDIAWYGVMEDTFTIQAYFILMYGFWWFVRIIWRAMRVII